MVFETRDQGDRFRASFHAALAAIEAAPPSKEAVETGLLRVKRLRNENKTLSAEEQASVFAQVAWLEQSGNMISDDVNGVVFNLGCEWDLQLAGELTRAFGGSTDGLN